MYCQHLLVSPENLQHAISDIRSNLDLGLDTETYGPRFGDRMFSLQISTEKHVWYFNFHQYGTGTPVLDRAEVVGQLRDSLESPLKTWFIHNAKFDLRRLALEGVHIGGYVHCTQMCERFIYNQYMKYSLKDCLERRGRKKDDAVEKYIAEHKLYSFEEQPGKKTKIKMKHFDRVPFDIMFRYGCIDAEEVRVLGIDQREKLKDEDYYLNDLKLEKYCYSMEEIGIKVRRDYARQGMQYELEQAAKLRTELATLAGEPFRNGPIWLKTIFDRHGVKYSINPKTGNPVFDKLALAAIDHPIGRKVRQLRKHEMYATTYYATYAQNDYAHAFIRTWGTDTGRFSYGDPNLQNVPKEEDLDTNIPFQVRGCFEPRTPDHYFVMIDFDQQEFRLLLDYAGEVDIIRQINETGMDVHQATADMLGVSRKIAKTLNFALLYGMGVDKLATALNIGVEEARTIKGMYFARFPKIKALIQQVVRTAEHRKWIKTWCGRKLHFPVKDFAYTAPNHLIQGGCADIARFAMVGCHELLQKFPKSNLLLQVHDELLFEIHKDDLHTVPELRSIMESTYKPFNGMRLTCGVEHSQVSWGKRDVVKGEPVDSRRASKSKD